MGVSSFKGKASKEECLTEAIAHGDKVEEEEKEAQ